MTKPGKIPPIEWEEWESGVFLVTPAGSRLSACPSNDFFDIGLFSVDERGYWGQDATIGDGLDGLMEEARDPDAVGCIDSDEIRVITLAIWHELRPKRFQGSFLFENEADARRAAELAYKALWSNAGARLPIWAEYALAAGWKAPDGWKPQAARKT